MLSIYIYISVFVWLGLIIMQVNLYGLGTIQIALKKKHYLQMQLFTKAVFLNQKIRFTNAAITKAAFVNVIYECGYYQSRIRKVITRTAFVNLKPLNPHSEEDTNAVILNNRIYKSNLQMRLYGRICISLIYECVLIKCGSIAAFVNVK